MKKISKTMMILALSLCLIAVLFGCTAKVESIEAVYTQGGGVVYTSSTLDSLKANLVVNEVLSDGTKNAVTDYTLSGALTAGESEVTVTRGDFTAKFKVNVTAVSVASVEAEFDGTDVFTSGTIDMLKEHLTVTATNNDGTSLVVTDYELEGLFTAGVQTFTVTYGGKTATFDVTVAKELTSISVVFDKGELFIPNNMNIDTALAAMKANVAVTANYSDGSSEVVSDGYTLEYIDEWGSGSFTSTSEIKVTYEGKETTFTFETDSSIRMTFDQGDNKIYTTSSFSALMPYLTIEEWTNESGWVTKTINAAQIMTTSYGQSFTSAGSVEMMIMNIGLDDTFTVEVTLDPLVSISATYAGGNKDENTSLDSLKSSLTVKATYEHAGLIDTKLSASSYTLSLESGETVLAVGENIVTVTYGEVTATFTVTGIALPPAKVVDRYEAVCSNPDGNYVVGSSVTGAFAFGGVTVTCYYTDGTSEVITSGFAFRDKTDDGEVSTTFVKEGERTIYVLDTSTGEEMATFTVTVKAA